MGGVRATLAVLVVAVLVVTVIAGCGGRALPGTPLERSGDEIMVAGRLFHTGAPVVLWTDPGGYDGYRVERRFAPLEESGWEAMAAAGKAPDSPNRYGLRRAGLDDAAVERVRGGGWELEELQGVVDQFVLHYDVCGTSRRCFRVLHDVRGLSVHFMLDIDGTIYQTLDVKERAWHATTSNDRSVGIEIANMGAYGAGERSPLGEWYGKDAQGRTIITIPTSMGDGGVRTPGFVGRPAREEPVVGEVQGREVTMYDLTPEQYESLTRLTATLCTVLPRIRCDYPRDAAGRPLMSKLPDVELAAFAGVLGHHHIQANKVDPGPALQWERVIGGARRLMRGAPAGLDPTKPTRSAGGS